MGRIQTNIGLITGVPIGDIVDQLMQLAARPKDLLVQRTDALKAEQVAVTELSALLLSVQYVSKQLGKSDLYDQRKVTSSNTQLLSATLTGNPPKGKYQFTPLATVQNQQLVSSGFKSDTAPLGGGTLSFRFGTHVERSTSLDVLNGGEGVTAGVIRITDRSGASAEINLSTARTIDDVLAAINGATAIRVTASTSGDRLRLTDTTGQTASNLKVEEVAGGSAAASLGLDGIDVAADTADGGDVLSLSADFDLDLLNDGRGVHRDPVFADVRYTLRDGTEDNIDLSPIIPGGSEVDRELTLGEILDRINAAAPDKLSVEIAPDGDRLVITDLTEGGGTFQLESLYDSGALAGLGLDGPSSDGVITGRRILGGLRTVLVESLNGGKGVGQLGSVAITDRSGASDAVNLAGAETLEEIIDRLNAAAVAVTARVNKARTGIELIDTSGETTSPLIIASGDATDTAEKLGIAVDAEVGSASSGDMHLQVVAHNTRLDSLNGGAGVARRSFRLTDSAGVTATIDLSDDDVQTIGDVIREINRSVADVVAELNDTGDGIRIRDVAGGPGTLRVVENGSTTAADLRLASEAVEVEIDGQPTQVLDGAMTWTIELDADDSLRDLSDRVNELGAGLAASVFYDGSTKPYRMTLTSDRGGKAGELVIDASGLDLGLMETVAAQDALMMLGDPAAAGPKVLISSSTNTFEDVLAGVSLQVQDASGSPVTVTVETTSAKLVGSVSTLVQNYNRFREKLKELTRYVPETNEASVLTGDSTALRLDTDLSRMLSGRFLAAGPIRSLAEVGISFQQDGTLAFDENRLKGAFQSDPDALREFFTDETSGFAAKFRDLIESLAGEGNSLMSQRLESLGDKIDSNEQRIQLMTGRLTAERDRLLLQFYRMETAIAKMQTNLTAIEQMTVIKPLTSSSKS